ncbi:MAG: AsmA-like C-terminal region-containing protein [Candidatus Sulfotelmatobacter sp.]
MNITAEIPRRRRARWPWWVGGGLLVFLAIIATIIDILAHRAEPFVRAQLVQALSNRFHARVELDSFHLSLGNTLRGEWGVWGEGTGLRIWPPTDAEGVQMQQPNPPVQPLIRLDEFHFHAPLRYQSGQPIHITQIRLKGLDIRFPPRSHMQRVSETQPGNGAQPPNATQSENAARTPKNSWNLSFVIDSVECTGARFTLETDKPNKLPLEFAIDHFRLKGVRSGEPMIYEAQVENPRPPGAIHTSGSFGPWVVDDPGSSSVRGDYTFNHADLSVFTGIAGMLNSNGSYQGTVRDLIVDGQTDTPDFQLSRSGHAMALHTTFHARVDGTNGDTWLEPVDATLASSHITAKGQVVRVLKMGDDGRLHGVGHDIALTVTVSKARIEDFLRLAIDSPSPILNGAVELKAQLDIPPGPDPVPRRISLKGQFVLDNAEFTSLPIQKRIRELSLRGQGKLDQLKSVEDDEEVKSHVEGDFTLSGGVLTLPTVTYSVPGADIHLHGTYRAAGDALDFTGTARMQATVSQMVGGWKGILLKPADRFFKKNGAGTEVPIYIAGTREKPQFGYNSVGAGGTHPQRPDTQP